MQNSTIAPAAAPTSAPTVSRIEEKEHGRLYHVVLLDDDEHTYDYVIEMLQKLFLFTVNEAFQHAVEVDTTGRTIVITCERPEAEFAKEQIQNYGADPRMPNCSGSMSAILIPDSGPALA
jgi:ATP-dependent Clp protease adaptor protein ClpS